jgi:hypothetical protein
MRIRRSKTTLRTTRSITRSRTSVRMLATLCRTHICPDGEAVKLRNLSRHASSAKDDIVGRFDHPDAEVMVRRTRICSGLKTTSPAQPPPATRHSPAMPWTQTRLAVLLLLSCCCCCCFCSLSSFSIHLSAGDYEHALRDVQNAIVACHKHRRYHWCCVPITDTHWYCVYFRINVQTQTATSSRAGSWPRAVGGRTA